MATALLTEPLVWLGDLPLNVEDDYGVEWIVTGLSGWSGSPSGTVEITARTGDHGGWASPNYLKERVLELSGAVIAPNRPALVAAIDRLIGSVGLGETTLRVAEGGLDRQAAVVRSGEVLVDASTRSATWSVPLTAPDPRRYSTAVGTGSTGLPSTTGGLTLPTAPPLLLDAVTVRGQIDAANDGTIPTRPLFTVSGPVVQPQIITLYPDGTVATLSYSDTLNDGDQLVIDTDAHTAMLNGTASRRRYLSGTWPEIPAGAPVAFQFRASSYDSDALLTAEWRSAWM